MSDYSGANWAAPGQPPPTKKRSPLLLLLIPVAACLFLAMVGTVIGVLASTAEDSASTTDETSASSTEIEGPGDGDFARCNDGTYSDNPELHGICSSHDGVDEWLAEYGECEDGTVIALRGDPRCPNGGDLARLRPGYVPEAGPDNIAKCNDGMFSDNRDLAATCSSHGGVEDWLADYGRCEGGEVIRLDDDPRCPGGKDLAALMPPGYAPPTTTEPPATTAAPTTAPPPPAAEDPFAGESVSQRNARRKAADYLDFQAFSRSGLIDQLEYEGFSQEDATYGVDALDVDWNEQAAKKAADYLDFQAFSRSGLIDQLVYEGFTQAQAEYGVSTTGL